MASCLAPRSHSEGYLFLRLFLSLNRWPFRAFLSRILATLEVEYSRVYVSMPRKNFKSTSPLLICFTPPLLGCARCFAFFSNHKFWTAHSEVKFDHHCSGIDKFVLHELAKKVKIQIKAATCPEIQTPTPHVHCSLSSVSIYMRSMDNVVIIQKATKACLWPLSASKRRFEMVMSSTSTGNMALKLARLLAITLLSETFLVCIAQKKIRGHRGMAWVRGFVDFV
jgi:hypothetical protein